MVVLPTLLKSRNKLRIISKSSWLYHGPSKGNHLIASKFHCIRSDFHPDVQRIDIHSVSGRADTALPTEFIAMHPNCRVDLILCSWRNYSMNAESLFSKHVPLLPIKDISKYSIGFFKLCIHSARNESDLKITISLEIKNTLEAIREQ